MFFWLVIGHFAADYTFQPDFIAHRKNRHNNLPAVPWYYVMASHCAMHAGVVAFLTGSLLLGVFEFVFHYLIDCGKCEGCYDEIGGIHFDQILHLWCKLVWLYLIFS